MWSAPVGILAIIGGWVTAETGRQPWVVYGRLRTEDAVSDLAPAHLVFSVIGFVVLYAVMLAAYIGYIVWAVRRGPEHDRPERSSPTTMISMISTPRRPPGPQVPPLPRRWGAGAPR